MAYDTAAADRVRAELDPLAPYEEKAMFGGLAFMVNTHMACGLISEGIMVRVGKDAHDDALARGARELTFTGRTMRGMVVLPDPIENEALAGWIGQAVAFALAEPPKKRR